MQTNAPQDVSFAKSSSIFRTASGIVIAIGLVLCAALLIQGSDVSSRIPSFASSTPSIVSPSISTSTSDGSGIIWKSIIGASPIREQSFKMSDSGKYATEYNARWSDIGTFAQGQYTGKTLALVRIYVQGNAGVSLREFVVLEPSGLPIAWDSVSAADYNPAFLRTIASSTGLGAVASTALPIPVELHSVKRLSNQAGTVAFATDGIWDWIDTRPTEASTTRVVDKTPSGFPVLRVVVGDKYDLSHQVDYLVRLPYGEDRLVSVTPDFVTQDGGPLPIVWSAGSAKVAQYNYGQYAYGWQDCYDGMTYDQLQAALVSTGKTSNGEMLYELDPSAHEKTYRCLFEKTKRYDYNPDTGTSASSYPKPYAQFITEHPMFFWKNPYGDMVAFMRSDVVPAAEKAKPVIYLYPQHNERVTVKVDPVLPRWSWSGEAYCAMDHYDA